MEYTVEEKRLAGVVDDAARALEEAYRQMRTLEWHRSTDRNTRLLYLWVEHAIMQKADPLEYADAIQAAPLCSTMKRLLEWDGFSEGSRIENPKASK